MIRFLPMPEQHLGQSANSLSRAPKPHKEDTITQILPICVAGSARPVGLSTGKRSSISAMAISGPTKRLTVNFPAW